MQVLWEIVSLSTTRGLLTFRKKVLRLSSGSNIQEVIHLLGLSDHKDGGTTRFRITSLQA